MIPRLRIPNSFPQTEVREAFGRDWIWPASDHWGWRRPLEQWGDLEEEIRKASLPLNSLIVQAGGCCGMYPWLLHRLFPEGLILTFEPDTFNFHLLKANCPSPHIIALNAALTNLDAGFMPLIRPSSANCGLHHLPKHPVPHDAPLIEWRPDALTLSLDTLHLHRLDALILDAEGSEDAILCGGLTTIGRLKPSIITAETISSEWIDALFSADYLHEVQGIDNVRDHVFRLNLESVSAWDLPAGVPEGSPPTAA